MKYLFVCFSLLISLSLSAQNSAKFHVDGNCGNCKSKIEKAANNLKGVSSAVWNVDSKDIQVKFDETMVSLDEIKKAIAAVGYDTDTVKATKSHDESCSDDKADKSASAMEMKGSLSSTFAVLGNCGGCKKRIENAAKSIEGVKSASWDSQGKKLTVTYDDPSLKLKKVKKAIAAVGHDTDQVKAKDKTYGGLPGCCQYERVL